MIDAQTATRLEDILRRESLSVLLYVHDAFPWTTASNNAALTQLQQIITSEKKAITALGQYLARKRVAVAGLGSFPSRFTTINFLSLQHILPLLLDYERRSIAELERDQLVLTDAEARSKVELLLAVKRNNLPLLEAMASPQPKSA